MTIPFILPLIVVALQAPPVVPGAANTLAWDLVKVLVPTLLAYWFATVKAKRDAEKGLDQKGLEQSVAVAVKSVETKLGERFDSLAADMDARERTSDRRLSRMEWTLWGVDERGGLKADHMSMEAKIEADHVILTDLAHVIREMYRRLLKEEPPPLTPKTENGL